MSALAAIDEQSATPELAVVGRDQDGRAVYEDHSVILPGTLRPDGSRRKDRRVRAEQKPDGTWRIFVPQEEVAK